MEKVHVFISTGRFHSLDEVQAFIDKTYTDDGDGIPSPFMREVGLSDYEPGCIEAIYGGHPTTLTNLLAGASYADQWLQHLDGNRTADAVICVFAPNRVRHPQGSSLEYVGSYEYKAV